MGGASPPKKLRWAWEEMPNQNNEKVAIPSPAGRGQPHGGGDDLGSENERTAGDDGGGGRGAGIAGAVGGSVSVRA